MQTKKMHRMLALVLTIALCITIMPMGMGTASATSTFDIVADANQSDVIYAAMGAPVRIMTKNLSTSGIIPGTPRWQILQGATTDAAIVADGTIAGEQYIDVVSSSWGACFVLFRYKEVAGGPTLTQSVEIKFCQITHTVLDPCTGRTQLIWNEEKKEFCCDDQCITETVYGRCPNKDGGYFENLPLYGATVDWSICTTPLDSAEFESTECMTDGCGQAKAEFCSDSAGVSTITVQTGYQLTPLNDQYPVDEEIATWTWYVEELVKIPQVRWAGEEVVMEKCFGKSYVGLPVNFVLENQSPGAFEDLLGTSQNVWTCVGPDGVARANFICETQGQVDAEAILYGFRDPEVNGTTNPAGDLLLGRLQIINKHGFVYYFMKMEDAYLGNITFGQDSSTCATSVAHPELTECVGEGVTQNGSAYSWTKWWGDPIDPTDMNRFANPPQDPKQMVAAGQGTTDKVTDTIWVTNEQLLRTRVRGWFTNDNPSARPQRIEGNLVLPAGRWVLPDDWDVLAMGNADMSHWDQFRKAWDLHEEEWDCIFGPTEVGDFAGKSKVIGPYNPLMDCTILANGELNWMDCPMPPAKISVKIVPPPGSTKPSTVADQPGYLMKADKGDIYWRPMVTDFLACCGPTLGKAYTAPFYKTMVPSHKQIPPFINNGGYDWDSWGFNDSDDPGDGPYDYWTIFNTDWSWANPNPTMPKEVQVYSDEHGEAMVWLSSGEDFCLDQWENELGGFDVPFGAVVGKTYVSAFADYPYLRKHPPTQTNTIDKSWKSAWFKTLKEEAVNSTQKKVVATLQDIHGNPICGEKIDWSIVAGVGRIILSNNGTIDGSGSSAVTTSDSDGQSWILIHNTQGTGTTDVLAFFKSEMIKRDLRLSWSNSTDTTVTYAGAFDKPWFLVAGPTGTLLKGWLYSYNPATGMYSDPAINGMTTASVSGVGYWGWYTTPTTVTLAAPATSPFSLTLAAGWNLVGNPFAKGAKIEKINNVQPVAYTFDNASYNYQLATTIPMGQAAWVYSTVGGVTLTLSEMP